MGGGGGGEQMNTPLISGGDSLLCIKPARHIQRDYPFPQGAPLAHELRTQRNNNKISLLRSTVETFIHVESRYSDVLLPCIMRKYKLINFACTHDIHCKALWVHRILLSTEIYPK